MYLSVIVPLHNERENLPLLLASLRTSLSALEHEVILVDDGSDDGTGLWIRNILNDGPSLCLVSLSRRSGQNSAILAGLTQARGDCLSVLDADLQYSPDELPALCDALSRGYDLVSGHRVNRPWNPARAVARCLIWQMTGKNLRDPLSPLKVCRAETVRDALRTHRYRSFLAVAALARAKRVLEVPVVMHPRLRGRSKWSLPDLAGAFMGLILLWLGKSSEPRFEIARVEWSSQS